MLEETNHSTGDWGRNVTVLSRKEAIIVDSVFAAEYVLLYIDPEGVDMCVDLYCGRPNEPNYPREYKQSRRRKSEKSIKIEMLTWRVTQTLTTDPAFMKYFILLNVISYVIFGEDYVPSLCVFARLHGVRLYCADHSCLLSLTERENTFVSELPTEERRWRGRVETWKSTDNFWLM